MTVKTLINTLNDLVAGRKIRENYEIYPIIEGEIINPDIDINYITVRDKEKAVILYEK